MLRADGEPPMHGASIPPATLDLTSEEVEE
jgi:hypothetical protein